MSPKISVITPSFNQGEYIEKTILSVLDQNYENYEHIVVDGGSTDGTVDILKRYPHIIWISEKDKGQADALNKGLKLASGEIVGWINSDDYYERDIFNTVLNCFQDTNTLWAIGNLNYSFDLTSEIVTEKSPTITFERLINNPDIVRQQPAFFRKQFLVRAGCWNDKYYMVMDYDLWLRLSKLAPPLMIDQTWAYFRIHAQQKTSLKNIIKQSNEINSILKNMQVPVQTRIKIGLKKRWLWFKWFIKGVLLDTGILSSQYQNRPMRLKVGNSS